MLPAKEKAARRNHQTQPVNVPRTDPMITRAWANRKGAVPCTADNFSPNVIPDCMASVPFSQLWKMYSLYGTNNGTCKHFACLPSPDHPCWPVLLTTPET